MEMVAIVIEKLRKKNLERNEYNKGDAVLLINQNSKTNIKKSCFKREKPKKGIKHQRTEGYDIKVIVTKVKQKVSYIRIIEIINEAEDI